MSDHGQDERLDSQSSTPSRTRVGELVEQFELTDPRAERREAREGTRAARLAAAEAKLEQKRRAIREAAAVAKQEAEAREWALLREAEAREAREQALQEAEEEVRSLRSSPARIQDLEYEPQRRSSSPTVRKLEEAVDSLMTDIAVQRDAHKGQLSGLENQLSGLENRMENQFSRVVNQFIELRQLIERSLPPSQTFVSQVPPPPPVRVTASSFHTAEGTPTPSPAYQASAISTPPQVQQSQPLFSLAAKAEAHWKERHAMQESGRQLQLLRRPVLQDGHPAGSQGAGYGSPISLSPPGPFQVSPPAQAAQSEGRLPSARETPESERGKVWDEGYGIHRFEVSSFSVEVQKATTTTFPDGGRIPKDSSVVGFYAATKVMEQWATRNSLILLHIPIRELQALNEATLWCPEIMPQIIDYMLPLLSSSVIKDALRSCCYETGVGQDRLLVFDTSLFQRALRNPTLFSRPSGARAPTSTSIMEVAAGAVQNAHRKMRGNIFASLSSQESEALQSIAPHFGKLLEEDKGDGSLLSVLYKCAAILQGNPSGKEVDRLSDAVNPMIRLNCPDPVHDTVPEKESVSSLFMRVVFIWCAFTGRSNGWVQEQLVYRQCSLLSLMTLALQEEDYLLDQLHRLMAEGPSAMDKSELFRLAQVIPTLTILQQNSGEYSLQYVRDVKTYKAQNRLHLLGSYESQRGPVNSAVTTRVSSPTATAATRYFPFKKGGARLTTNSHVAALSNLDSLEEEEVEAAQLAEEEIDSDLVVATTTPNPVYPPGMNAGRKPVLPPAASAAHRASDAVPSSFRPSRDTNPGTSWQQRSPSPSPERERRPLDCYLCLEPHPGGVQNCPLLALARASIQPELDRMKRPVKQTALQAAFTAAAIPEEGYYDVAYDRIEDIDPADLPADLSGLTSCMAVLLPDYPEFGYQPDARVHPIQNNALLFNPLLYRLAVMHEPLGHRPNHDAFVAAWDLDQWRQRFLNEGLIAPFEGGWLERLPPPPPRAPPIVDLNPEPLIEGQGVIRLHHIIEHYADDWVVGGIAEEDRSSNGSSVPPPLLYEPSSSLSSGVIPSLERDTSYGSEKDSVDTARSFSQGGHRPHLSSRVTAPRLPSGGPPDDDDGGSSSDGGSSGDEDDEPNWNRPRLSRLPRDPYDRRTRCIHMAKQLAAGRMYSGHFILQALPSLAVFISQAGSNLDQANNFAHQDLQAVADYPAAVPLPYDNFDQLDPSQQLRLLQYEATLQPFNWSNPSTVLGLLRSSQVMAITQSIAEQVRAHCEPPDWEDRIIDFRLWTGSLLAFCTADSEVARCLAPHRNHQEPLRRLIEHFVRVMEDTPLAVDVLALGQTLQMLYTAALDAFYLGHHLALLLARMLREDMGTMFEVHLDPVLAEDLVEPDTWRWCDWTNFPLRPRNYSDRMLEGHEVFLSRAQEESLLPNPSQSSRYHDWVAEMRAIRPDSVPVGVPYFEDMDRAVFAFGVGDPVEEPPRPAQSDSVGGDRPLAATHIIAFAAQAAAHTSQAPHFAALALTPATSRTIAGTIPGPGPTTWRGSARSRYATPQRFLAGPSGDNRFAVPPLPSSLGTLRVEDFARTQRAFTPVSYQPQDIDYEGETSWFPQDASFPPLVSAATVAPHSAVPGLLVANEDMQAEIDAIIARSISTARLDYFDQSHSNPVFTVGIIVAGQRLRPSKVFLDLGATISLMGITCARLLGLDIYESSVRLATSTLSAQRVVGVTAPLIIQFGVPPYHIDFRTVLLITQGMDRLYDVLISNQVSHAFKGIVNHHDQPSTFTLIRPVDGATIVLPLRPSF